MISSHRNLYAALASDDEDDDNSIISRMKGRAKKIAATNKQQKTLKLNVSKATIPFLVENVSKKPKKKNKPKTQQVEAHPIAKTDDEDQLNRAIKISKETYQLEQIARNNLETSDKYSTSSDKEADRSTEDAYNNGKDVTSSPQLYPVNEDPEEIERLTVENEELRKRFQKVKNNYRLCLQLVHDCEYDDIREVLVENHRLKKENEETKDQLSEANQEIEILSTSVQQLKTKNNELDKALKKALSHS